MPASSALTKQGYPRGFRFMPGNLEIFQILADYRLRGRPLPPPVAEFFHDVRILDHHPQELYEQYKEYEEAGCIYFFSRQEFMSSAIRAPNDGKRRPRPTRSVCGGLWKPSGGCRYLNGPPNQGGGVAGRMVTMVFYEKRRAGAVEKQIKTNWGLHEFTVPVGPNKYSKLAVYRLYKVKNGVKGGNQQQANVADHHVPVLAVADHHVPAAAVAIAHHHMPSTSAAETSATGRELVAASTSLEQKPLISIEQIQHYHNQYAFRATAMPEHCIWAPPPAATNLQVDTKPVPVTGAPGYCQFVAPSEQGTTVPPAAVNPEKQKSSTATAMHGSVDHFGGTRSPPATPTAASPATQQRAPAVSPSHARFAGRDETMEQDPSKLGVVPPQPVRVLPVEDDDRNATLWNAVADEGILDTFDDFLLLDGGDIEFSMDELIGTDNTSTGDGNNLAR